MNISPNRMLEKAVKEKVDSGLYNRANVVIREALRLSLKLDAENDGPKREAAIGYAQLKAEETVRIRSKRQFLAVVRSQS